MNGLKLPLPVYETIGLGTIMGKDGTSFKVIAGLDRDLVRQLKEKSLDESDKAVQANTSDKQRFGEGSYEDWYGKERTPFALVDSNSGALAALAWFGPKPLGRKSLKYLSEQELKEEYSQEKDDWYTVVYRSYAPYRGKGLMTDFLQQTMDIYLQQYPGAKLWVGMSADNAASAALAARLGFKKVEGLEDEKANWLAMTKE